MSGESVSWRRRRTEGRGQGLMNSLLGDARCGCRLSGPRCRYMEEEETNWGWKARTGTEKGKVKEGENTDTETDTEMRGKYGIVLKAYLEFIAMLQIFVVAKGWRYSGASIIYVTYIYVKNTSS